MQLIRLFPKIHGVPVMLRSPEQHMTSALRVEASCARWSLTEYAQARRAVPPNTRACREKGTYGDILL